MRVNCDHGDDFPSLWQKVIDEFEAVTASAPTDRQPALKTATEKATEVLNFDVIGPNQVRVAFRHLTQITPVVIFFDEFDQISDGETLTLVSNTIKLLSDQLEEVTLVPVGVSESVADLIAGHLSIQRNLAQVRLPRMDRNEIEGILDNGLAKLNMSVTEEARRFVRIIPRGFPQYAHLLAQEGARHAIYQDQTTITFNDIFSGTEVGLRKLDHSLSTAFDEATITANRSNYADVLFACVWGKPDSDGYFSPASIREAFSIIAGRARDIHHFNPQLKTLSEERGQILHRKGTTRLHRYRFSDPLMEPYVLLRGMQSGRIDPARMLRSDDDSTESPQPS